MWGFKSVQLESQLGPDILGLGNESHSGRRIMTLHVELWGCGAFHGTVGGPRGVEPEDGVVFVEDRTRGKSSRLFLLFAV